MLLIYKLGGALQITQALKSNSAAGPKLRKWYGEGERIKEGKDKPDPEDIEEGDAVLVTDGDSPIGELVLLQLIVARWTTAFAIQLLYEEQDAVAH